MIPKLSIRKRASSFDIEDWESQPTAVGFTYRPGGVVLMWRIAALLCLTLLAAGLLSPVPRLWEQVTRDRLNGPNLSPEAASQAQEMQERRRQLEQNLKQMMPEEQWQRIQAELREKRLQREAAAGEEYQRVRWLGAGLLGVYLLIPAFIGWLALQYGLLAIVRYPVERLEIRRTPDHQLEVIHRGLLRTSTVKTPLGDLLQLSWYARRVRTRYYLAWIWAAVVIPKAGSFRTRLAFQIERQKHEPNQLRAPDRVRKFLDDLARLTGLPIEPPSIHAEPSGRQRVGWKQTFTTEKASEHTQEYKSLDEMPPHVRQMFERLQSDPEAKKKGVVESFRVTVRDSDGRERTYTRLEDMPPDLRERIEQQRKKR